jgi:hypothetical protein
MAAPSAGGVNLRVLLEDEEARSSDGRGRRGTALSCAGARLRHSVCAGRIESVSIRGRLATARGQATRFDRLGERWTTIRSDR